MKDFHKQKTLPDLKSSDRKMHPLPVKIGPYKIESLLNKGGMSYLYLGLHPGTVEPIVVKVLSPKFLKNKEIAARFLKEAQIIGMTDHPNIVKLYGQGSWENGLYIAMEFIRGVSLRQFIQQKSLSHKRALQIILQVAYALCHLHTHGVIHRDLKPENILITENGEIKVIDFGIAQLQGEEELQPKRMMGTPAYMSPEQKENPAAVSYLSDIYSLGIIAYELLLGRLSHGIIHLSLLTKELRQIIEKALKTNPKERTQDIVDFITEISHYLKGLGSELTQKPEEVSDEVLDMIQKTRSILVPLKPPRWPQVEIGIAIQEGMSLSGLYLDFFRLSDNLLCLVVAEAVETTNVSLFSCSLLRGMIRMSIAHAKNNGKKDFHPITLLTTLNQALLEDSIHHKFTLSLLLLDSEKERLSFIACDHAHLWHIPEGAAKPRILSTPNPPLGTESNTPMLETADNWRSGDILLLHTCSKKEETHLPLLEEIILLSPQIQAERMLDYLVSKRATPAKRAAAVLSLHRLF